MSVFQFFLSVFFVVCLVVKPQIPKKSFLECRLEKSKLDHSFGFRFRSGYADSIGFRPITDFVTILNAHSTYSCPTYTKEVLDAHQYVTDSQEYFNSTNFLNLLSGKTLGMLGDSLGEQLFNALDVELFPLMHPTKSMSPGNGTHRFFSLYQGKPDVDPYPRIKAAYRFYEPYDAHIIWCKDQLLHLHPTPLDSFCRTRTMKADILVLNVGAHFKPESQSTLQAYYQELENKAANLESQLLAFRHHLFKLNGPDQVVIWRLNSHVGPIDEYNSIYNYNHTYDHTEPYFWDEFHDRDTQWVTRFNAITRAVADLHRDPVLDHYTTSLQLLRHEIDRVHVFGPMETRPSSTQHYPIHVDSLHYCAGTLFRTAPLLLYKHIEHAQQCASFRHHNSLP